MRCFTLIFPAGRFVRHFFARFSAAIIQPEVNISTQLSTTTVDLPHLFPHNMLRNNRQFFPFNYYPEITDGKL